MFIIGALVNPIWLSMWPHLEVEAKDPQFSDYSLTCVAITVPLDRHARPFKFLNHLCDYKEFMSIVEATWLSLTHGNYIVKV